MPREPSRRPGPEPRFRPPAAPRRTAPRGARREARRGAWRDDDDGLLAHLRAAAADYARASRAGGASPEQVRAGVRALVRTAFALEGCHDPAARHALTGRVLRWSLDAYHNAYRNAWHDAGRDGARPGAPGDAAGGGTAPGGPR